MPGIATNPTDGPVAAQRSLADAKLWFGLGVLSLLVVGPMSIVLVLARLPVVSEWMFIDAGFPRRALVVHVNVALGVWFFVMLAGLFCLLPGARPLRLTRVSQGLALLGTLVFMSSMFIGEAEPVRSNYVPALDHGLFLAGLALFAGAIALNFLDARMVSRSHTAQLPPGTMWGMRMGGLAYVLALGTIAAAWATQSAGMTPLQFYERLFWGGGHVLQFAHVLGMCSAWLLLLWRIAPAAAQGLGPAWLLAWLATPSLAGPWLGSRGDSAGWFTLMMQFGIFPPVLLLLLLIGTRLLRAGVAPGALRTPEFVGTATAACMTLIGFVLGALISGQTTLIPAHYHVSIGAVTATYMAVIMAMLPNFGLPLSARMRRLATWQPLVFGVGQVVMALGFGAAALERKVYGAEQELQTPAEVAAMSVMGLGGAIALAGGLIFVVVIAAGWQGRIANFNLAGRR